MKYVYLLIDQEKNVIAIYDDEALTEKLKQPIEEKLKIKLTIDKRTVNLDLQTVGILR